MGSLTHLLILENLSVAFVFEHPLQRKIFAQLFQQGSIC